MKRLILALWVLLFIPTIAILSSPVFAQNQTKLCFTTNGSNCVPGLQASNSVAISNSSASTTELVALSATKAIYITSWDVMASNTNNVSLKYGTGTNCGTGTTALTGAYPLIAQAGIAKGNGTGPILMVPRGNALCITASGASLVAGSLSYVQF